MKKSRKSFAARGFTLIELIMVIVILASLAVVASPFLQNIPNIRAQMAAFKLRSDIRYAQLLAIQSSVRSRVVFNSGTHSYQLERDNGSGTFIAVMNPATRQNYTVTLNSGDFQGVTFSVVQLASPAAGNPNIVVFDALGAPSYINLTGSFVPLQEPASVELNSLFRLRFRALTGKVDIVNL